MDPNWSHLIINYLLPQPTQLAQPAQQTPAAASPVDEEKKVKEEKHPFDHLYAELPQNPYLTTYGKEQKSSNCAYHSIMTAAHDEKSYQDAEEGVFEMDEDQQVKRNAP